jgi:hypothetical protein
MAGCDGRCVIVRPMATTDTTSTHILAITRLHDRVILVHVEDPNSGAASTSLGWGNEPLELEPAIHLPLAPRSRAPLPLVNAKPTAAPRPSGLSLPRRRPWPTSLRQFAAPRHPSA